MGGTYVTYQKRLSDTINNYSDRNRIQSLDKSISKLYLLDLDKMYDLIKPLYPDYGRPAKNQQAIFRSLVLMLDQKIHSLTNWAEKVMNDKLLSDICGFDGSASGVASYYEFIDRLWINNDKYKNSAKSKLRHYTGKPRKN